MSFLSIDACNYHSKNLKGSPLKTERSLMKDIENLVSRTIRFRNSKKKEHLRKQKLQGHVIRSRAQWVEKGEKPINIFVM